MAASSETGFYIYARCEIATDSGDHTTYTLHGYDAQTVAVDPTYGIAPAVYVDGVEQDTADYTFNVGDSTTHCSITFDSAQTASAEITCDYKWKYPLTTDEDFTAYEFDKEVNQNVLKDVNGRNMVVESYNRCTGWRAMLAWEYISKAFWDEIQLLAEEKHYTFDVERVSLTDPFDRVNDLYMTNYPKFVNIPGLPDYYNIAIECVQLGG